MPLDSRMEFNSASISGRPRRGERRHAQRNAGQLRVDDVDRSIREQGPGGLGRMHGAAQGRRDVDGNDLPALFRQGPVDVQELRRGRLGSGGRKLRQAGKELFRRQVDSVAVELLVAEDHLRGDHNNPVPSGQFGGDVGGAVGNNLNAFCQGSSLH